MKHIRKFETTADFEADRPTLALPNVSLVTQTNTINYLPYGGTPSEPEWVEINGVKWATKNLGATDKYYGGLYYQWGDTQGYTVDQVGKGEGKKYFGLNDYKYYNDSSYTKYNSNEKNVMEAADDAATVALGSNWKIPTREQVESLINACTVEYYEVGGSDATYPVNGYIFTYEDDNEDDNEDDKSKTLFFPVSYDIIDGKRNTEDPANCVWINEIQPAGGGESDSIPEPDIFVFEKYTIEDITQNPYIFSMNRYYGAPIRPVYIGA